MIEERIIEWIDLGDTMQKIDIYQKKRLLYFFKFHYLLIKHGIASEIVDIIFQFIFFLQIINLSCVNIESKNDLILEILKYIEEIILPQKVIINSKSYLIASIVFFSINFIHIILTIILYVLLIKKITVKILFLFMSILNFIIYYYLIGPIIYLFLSGSFCKNGTHKILKVNCYSDTTHIIYTVLNLIFGLYSLFIIETFSLYYNQIGQIYGPNIKSRVICYYDIYSSNAKLIVYIISFFYGNYENNSKIFKYVYQSYIFLSSFILTIYSIKSVFYYNKIINTLIHFYWCFVSWFSLCMIIKITFNINDSSLLILFGLILIIIVFIYQEAYSYYKRITQLDLFNIKKLISIERFNFELIDLYNSTKKVDKLLLNGIIKKFEDYIINNPELNEVYNKLKNDENLRKKFYSLNQLSMLSLIFTIYFYYLEKSDIKTDITLHMCYFLINKFKNPTFAIFLISKLTSNNHSQLYHKFMLMENIKNYLINKLIRKSFKNSINNVQMGSVILYYQYFDLLKLKIYDATSNQINYFDTLRNNINTGKVTENFLKTGENILILRKEIFKIWEKIMDLNPFSNECENDYLLYLKTILQDDILAQEEEKKFSIIKSSKLPEKNNIYHSMFKNDINSILLIDGFSMNPRILYATPNFSFLYRFNGKEIINTPIEELLPNVIQSFHKDLIDNILKYSNISNAFQRNINIYIKGKNNSLFSVNLFIKPVPNLAYGLIYFALLTKNQDHEFTLILDKDFKIDGFTEMNQGNNFTLSSNSTNSYNLSSQIINHHIGLIIPEILIQLCYKDNILCMEKNDIDVKGTLHSINNFKDLDEKIISLIDNIKKTGFFNIGENTDESRKILREYNELKEIISEKKNKSYSIFFKVETRIFLNGRYRYHRLYVTNDNLYLTEKINYLDVKTLNMTASEFDDDKKNDEKLSSAKPENGENGDNKAIKTPKKLSNFGNLYLVGKEENSGENFKGIRLKVNKEIKIENEENMINNNDENMNLFENNLNNAKNNLIDRKENLDIIGFNRFKAHILNKKDSIQIIIMKLVSLLFVIIIVILAVYDYLFSNNLYSGLVEYLSENLYFTHSKIISSCIYISAINIKWLKYKFIDENSCLMNCTFFYLKTLDKCIKNLKSEKDILYTYDSDFQNIILTKTNLSFQVYNREYPDILIVDLNDYINLILSKGVKLKGSFNDYHNNYGRDRITMENLLYLSLNYFKSEIQGLNGNKKLSRINSRFRNNYLRIIIGVALCIILLAIFLNFVFDFTSLELFFLDKLINFNSQNFENYLRSLDDLKKKLKNTKVEDEENNLDELGYDISNDDIENNSKKNENKKLKIKNKKDENGDHNKKINKKNNHKKNKIQQQRIKKKKIMSFYFYKENILFGFKISLILICFISFFIVSFILYKSYFNNFLEFDTAFNNIEDLYYNSFKIFLNFKSELEKFQSNHTYKMTLPSSKDIQMPNFGNILNDLNQKSVYKKENIKLLKQLYNGDLCLLLFYNQTTLDYSNCKSFLSSILLKGMEQAIIRMGVMINSVIDELSVINNIDDFNYTVNGNSTNFKKYETFIEYYLLLSYLKNEEIFNSLRIDETKKVSDISLEIIVIYLLVYFVLFFLLCYFIFMYKYIYNSLFNFVGILAFKFIIDDEYLYHKIIEIENKLYK